jgi:hypothetical protein
MNQSRISSLEAKLAELAEIRRALWFRIDEPYAKAELRRLADRIRSLERLLADAKEESR